jgi:predicted transcriptional regulator
METDMAKVRLNMEVSEDLARLLDTLADEEDVTRTEIVRRALSVMKVYKSQIEAGRPHMGFVKEASKLDAELVGVLTTPEPPKVAKPATNPSN